MALRFDAAGDYVTRASALTVTNFTACGWAQIVSDLGSAIFQPILVATAAFGTDLDIYLSWSTDLATSMMSVGSYDGAVNTRTDFASRPAVGDWFHWYIQCSGTGAGNAGGGWRRLQDAAYVTQVNTPASGATGTVGLRLADSGFNDPCNIRLAAIKVWSAVLTAAEIENERLTFAPQRTANLAQWHPMVHNTVANCALDFGGAGANFTTAGTLTIEDGPPIAFRQGHRRLVIPAAAAAAAPTWIPGSFDNVLRYPQFVSW